MILVIGLGSMLGIIVKVCGKCFVGCKFGDFNWVNSGFCIVCDYNIGIIEYNYLCGIFNGMCVGRIGSYYCMVWFGEVEFNWYVVWY